LKLLTLRGFSEKSFRAHPKVKTFYNMLDNGGIPNCSQANNKENFGNQHHCEIGDLRDPFEADQIQRNPYNSGQNMNPYSQRKQGATSFSTNPYQQTQHQGHTQTTNRFSPVPQSVPMPPPNSTSSVSPTLTQDQVKRMEENRKRALAIRKKQGNS